MNKMYELVCSKCNSKNFSTENIEEGLQSVLSWCPKCQKGTLHDVKDNDIPDDFLEL
jgi:ribosomal protein L33